MNILDFYIPEWFWVAFNLLVLILVLKKILWDRVGRILEERRETVLKTEQDAEEARTLKAEIEQLRAELDEDLKSQTAGMMQEARKSAGTEYDRIIAEAESKAALIVSAAHTKARQEQGAIMTEIKEHVAATAVEAAGILLRANMDNEKNKRLLEEFLSERDLSA